MFSNQKAKLWSGQKAMAKAQELFLIDNQKETKKQKNPILTLLSTKKPEGDQFLQSSSIHRRKKSPSYIQLTTQKYYEAFRDWTRSRRKNPLIVFLKNATTSKLFQGFILLVIVLNVVTIAFEPIAADSSSYNFNIFIYLEIICLSVYISEFLVKLYCEPIRYWRSNYNRFDFVILMILIAQFAGSLTLYSTQEWSLYRALNSMRALISLRVISFIRRLQVVVNALLNTLIHDAIHILMLLFLVMFVFAIVGHYLFGLDSSKRYSYSEWNTLPSAIYSLWVYVTCVQWHHYHMHLLKDGYIGSELFTATFIFLGSFIISNLFIGVICLNMDEATENDRLTQLRKRTAVTILKKRIFLKKQALDMKKLLAHRGEKNVNLQEVLQKLAGTLRNDDVVPMMHLSCNLNWLETYTVSLDYHENTLYRCQQTHFALAHTLAEFLDRKLNARLKQER